MGHKQAQGWCPKQPIYLRNIPDFAECLISLCFVQCWNIENFWLKLIFLITSKTNIWEYLTHSYKSISKQISPFVLTWYRISLTFWLFQKKKKERQEDLDKIKKKDGELLVILYPYKSEWLLYNKGIKRHIKETDSLTGSTGIAIYICTSWNV